MGEFIKPVLEAPVANLLIVAGLAFLAIAVVGTLSGKIDPGRTGRIASGAIGAILLGLGLAMHLWRLDGERSPRILHFSADPPIVAPDKQSRLCYGVADASGARIDPQIGEVEPLANKCVTITPPQTTTYTLTARTRDGQEAARSLEIKVQLTFVVPPPAILHFSAHPPTVAAGQRGQLCYGVARASSARIEPEIGRVEPLEKECVWVTPLRTTTYVLIARNTEGKEARREVALEVTAPVPSGLRVVEAFLRADPSEYSGPCPVTIRFSGRISIAGGAGRVSYRFLRSDGASAPIQTLTFDSPGSRNVSTTWRLGGPGLPTYSGWQVIEILEPQELKSKRANFGIQCRREGASQPLGEGGPTVGVAAENTLGAAVNSARLKHYYETARWFLRVAEAARWCREAGRGV